MSVPENPAGAIQPQGQGMVPPLDTDFRPAWLWSAAYEGAARAHAGARPAAIVLKRPEGGVSRFDTVVLPDAPGYSDATLRYLERSLKFLLWSRGGCHVQVAAPDSVVRALQLLYAPDGLRGFDAEFMGQRIYLNRFRIEPCALDRLPDANEDVMDAAGGLDGCRIGFDLGGSDRKAAAVQDGRVVFSEEIRWDPYFQSDPAYHEAGIRDSLRRAAAHLPRVDAIGGSAAGVYVDNEPRVASLFRGVSEADFEAKVRPLFKRIGTEWNVPITVVNDGDVTALAARRMIAEGEGPPGGVLGLALGTSLAAGYVAPGGRLMRWLNELAFVPVDWRNAEEGGHVEEWSGDVGTGARYLSQQALTQLLNGFPDGVPKDLPLPERLVRVQDAMAEGARWAYDVYASYGVYLGAAIRYFAQFYDFTHVLALGRVASGAGGELIVEVAQRYVQQHEPALAARTHFVAPDETFKRHGQAIAAASLPTIPPTAPHSAL